MAVIVTAEDDPDLRGVITQTLTRDGHDVMETADGAAAFALMQERHPDLVVTDGEMPRMTGFELCEQMKAVPNLSKIPVLLVTGSLTPAQIEAGVPCASGYLVKPFTVGRLRDAVNSLLAA